MGWKPMSRKRVCDTGFHRAEQLQNSGLIFNTHSQTNLPNTIKSLASSQIAAASRHPPVSRPLETKVSPAAPDRSDGQIFAVDHLTIRLDLQPHLRERAVFKNRHAKFGDFLEPSNHRFDRVGKRCSRAR